NNDEHHLPPRLPIEIQVLRRIKQPTHKHGEQQHIPHDAHRPRPHQTFHATPRTREAEKITDDLTPQDRDTADPQGGVEKLSYRIHDHSPSQDRKHAILGAFNPGTPTTAPIRHTGSPTPRFSFIRTMTVGSGITPDLLTHPP